MKTLFYTGFLILLSAACKKKDKNPENTSPDFSISGYPYIYADIRLKSNQAPGTTLHWSFGDGGSSSDGTPLHRYVKAGNYTITLTSNDQTITKNYQHHYRAGENNKNKKLAQRTEV